MLKELNLDLWKAKAVIYPSSYLDISIVDGQFRPKAHLNGKMNMNIGLKSDDGVLDAMRVKTCNLKISRLKV